MDDEHSGGGCPPPRQGAMIAPIARLAGVLPPEIHHRLAEMFQHQTIPAGEVLVRDGQEPDHVGYVTSGMLGMVKELTDGRRHIIGLLIPSDMYGRLFDGPSSYRIEALAESEVISCPRESLEDILRGSPQAERLFLVNVLDELDAAREWVLVLGGPKVVQRVASFILILCRRRLREAPPAPGAPMSLRLAIRRADLAHYLGTRPESLSRAFHNLAARGILRLDGPYDFDVTDLRGLIEIAGQDLVMDETDQP